MKLQIALIIALLLVISGCSQRALQCAPPSIPLQNGCCLDINRNGVCDRAENAAEVEEIAEAQYDPTAEIPEEAAESSVSETAKSSSPLAPTATPVIGTRGKETRDTTGWEFIKLYYHDSIERCGKTIQLVSADSSVAAGDSITLQIGIPRDTITKEDKGLVIESGELYYMVESFAIVTGSDEGQSSVKLKVHCK